VKATVKIELQIDIGDDDMDKHLKIKEIASIAGETMAEGAKVSVAKHRNAIVKNCVVSYSEQIEISRYTPF